MAMGTERSKPLHNFTLPCDLRWGNQRFLRCMKVNSDGDQISPRHRGVDANSSGSSDHHLNHHQIQQRRTTRDRGRDRERDKDSPPSFANGSTGASRKPPPAAAAHGGTRRFGDVDDDGVAATRVKVMGELQTAADQMKNAYFKDACLEEGEVSGSRPLLPPPPPPPPASVNGDTNRPWNLRTRRAACRTPTLGIVSGRNGGAAAALGGGSLRVDSPKPITGSTQMRAPATAQKSPIHRSDKTERAKFSVALSKREIEEDFFSIAGHRPPRRPKKRARTVQRQLDTLFPGLWLSEVTPDMYEVPEAAP
ncbi:hypothetical protein CASFOL_009846 [Castilleja foliolosa]|uniref:DUF1639 family protein n=1 Tax=Castilleja foliolosa TaxID=1961234 RepID=A0ABD3DV00_9LAMI